MVGDDGGMAAGFRRAVKDLSRAPAPKQIGVGAAVGWVTGYATMKVGKMAATAVGGSLLLLQVTVPDLPNGKFKLRMGFCF